MTTSGQSPADLNETYASTHKPLSWSGVWKIALLLLLFFLFFYQLGSYPLFDVDEPRYSEAAREMIESGDWITPYFNYEIRLHKPPLFYWLVSISYLIFGVTEFAARLPSALAAAGIVLATYFFGRRAVSHQVGLASSVILASCLMMTGLSRMAITDMTLSFFMVTTTMCLYLAAHENRKWWIGAGILAGFGILTKGPVAILVPGAILVVYSLLTRQFLHAICNRWMLFGTLIALGIAAPWYLAAYKVHGQYFLDSQFFNNMTRYGDTVSGHRQPWFFYFIVMFVGFLPWMLYLPKALVHYLGDFKQNLKEKSPTFYLVTFALVWGVFIFTFFTFAKTKLLTYILPMFPALAIIVGVYFEDASSKISHRLAAIPAWLLFVGGGVTAVVMLNFMSAFMPSKARHISNDPTNIIALLFMVVGVGIVAWLIQKKQMKKALWAQAFTLAVAAVVAMHSLIPKVNHLTQGKMLSYVDQVGQAPVFTYDIVRPSLIFYTRRKIVDVNRNDRDKLAQLYEQFNQDVFVIMKTRWLDKFNRMKPDAALTEIIDEGKIYSLVRLKAPTLPTEDLNR